MKHLVLKRQLKQGSIIPIFLNWKEQKEFRGNAILVERKETRNEYQDRIYEFCEIGDSLLKDRKQEKISVIYDYQRWVIKFIDGNHAGFQTAVNIAYYSKTAYTNENNNE